MGRRERSSTDSMTYELSTLAPLPGLTFDLANGCEPRRAAASLWVPLNYSSASCQQRLITVVGSENMACNRANLEQPACAG